MCSNVSQQVQDSVPAGRSQPSSGTSPNVCRTSSTALSTSAPLIVTAPTVAARGRSRRRVGCRPGRRRAGRSFTALLLHVETADDVLDVGLLDRQVVYLGAGR